MGGYLRSAEIGCPRKSHPRRHLQRSVSSRIDNLPERDAGLRDFALVPQLPLEFPGCPALHGAQRARTSEFWNSPMGDEQFRVAGLLKDVLKVLETRKISADRVSAHYGTSATPTMA